MSLYECFFVNLQRMLLFILQLWAKITVHINIVWLCASVLMHIPSNCCRFNKRNIFVKFISLVVSLLFRCESLFVSLLLLFCLHPDSGKRHASFSREREGDALLVISTFIDEERIKRFFAFVPQCFTRESLEKRVFGVERAEVSVLRGKTSN